MDRDTFIIQISRVRKNCFITAIISDSLPVGAGYGFLYAQSNITIVLNILVVLLNIKTKWYYTMSIKTSK